MGREAEKEAKAQPEVKKQHSQSNGDTDVRLGVLFVAAVL